VNKFKKYTQIGSHRVEFVERVESLLQNAYSFVDFSVVGISGGEMNVLLEMVNTQLAQSYLHTPANHTA